MGLPSKQIGVPDAVDVIVCVGFLCIVIGVAWRYDLPLALIVLGCGLLSFGILALWRRR
jgi:ABC-type bacteriocin/lantibiotic exporter with double-glycine peptidase domain